MSSISTNDYKLCLLSIKYIPIVCVLIQVIYLIFYIIGYDLKILIYISGMSVIPIIVVYNILKIFKYCIIQKIIIVYNSVTDLLISIDVDAHYILLILGILLILIIIYRLIISKINIRIKYNYDRAIN